MKVKSKDPYDAEKAPKMTTIQEAWMHLIHTEVDWSRSEKRSLQQGEINGTNKLCELKRWTRNRGFPWYYRTITRKKTHHKKNIKKLRQSFE